MTIKKILRECGLDYRLEILNMLSVESLTLSGIKSRLRKLGVSKPYATVGRYVDNLIGIGLVEERDSRFYITNAGKIALHYFTELERSLSFINSQKEINNYSLDYLPAEFYSSLASLSNSEVVKDPLTLVARILDMIEKAESRIDILASDTSREFAEHLLRKVANKGVGTLLRAESDGIKIHIIYPERAISETGIFSSRGLRVRVYPDVRMHIFIVDNNMAILNLPTRDGKPHLNSGFFSSDSSFIEFSKKLFNYFWNRSKEIEI